MKKILLIKLFFVGLLQVFGQTNVAPLATPTCNSTSGGTTSGGGWNWTQINNGVNTTCGNQEAFIWSQNPPASTDYMDFTWNIPRTVGKIIFHNAWNNTRNMTGCQVQYWNGTSFVNWYNTSNSQIAQACIDSISFPPITTTVLRLTNIRAAGSGQTSNLSWREIQIISASSVNFDAGVSGLSKFDLCDYNQPITTTVFNYGKFDLDSVMLYWSINNTLQTPIKIKGKIRKLKDTLITLSSSYTLIANTNYSFKLWTSAPNNQTDSVPQNDTLRYSFFFMGNPNPPTTSDFTQCGNGFPRLRGTPNSSLDSILWFDQSTGGTLLGIGRNIQGPYLTQSKTFYAQAAKYGTTFETGFAYSGGTILSAQATAYNGYTFNVNCTKTSVIDSITVRLYWNYNNTNLVVYYKTGTAVGFHTNSTAWTLVNSERARFFTQGGQFFARISAKNLMLNGGTLYGFYISTDPTSGSGNDLWAKFGTLTDGNADLSFTGIGYVYGLFGSQGFYSPYTADCKFMIKNQCNNSTRVPLTVTVKPRPTGAEIVTGLPFQGQVKLGIPSSPDIIELGKTLTYELSPPTGFNNADHGNTWEVNNVVARTRFNVIVPDSHYTVVPPSSTGPGTLTYIPRSEFLDSFITFSVNYSDLGPHFCDSTVVRTLVVAPTPKPSFVFPASICLGEAVLFENTTTIHSGNNSFMWYFDNGDSSDLNSPVYEYPQAGIYNVRLRATSFPWNVIKDTVIVVEVGELPTVAFRVNNKCEGVAVTFANATFVANGALTFQWTYGDGTPTFNTTSMLPVSHLYPSPGSYRVTLRAEANGCVSTLTKNAYQFAKPVSNFIVPSGPVCANSNVSLTNTSTISQGLKGALWNLGDGKVSTQNNINHMYANPNTYNVKLTSVSEFDCRDSVVKQVTIIPTPKPNFSGDQFCDNKLTNFTNTSLEALPNPIYTWTISDGFTAQSRNVSNKQWSNNGPVQVTLHSKYTNLCESSITKDFEILIQPKAKFTVQDICSGESARFVNLTEGDRAGIQYLWDFGNGTDNTPAPVRLYNNAQTQTYTVKLVASYAAGCGDTASESITVSESPTCGFAFKHNGFLDVDFTPSNTSYTKYEWFFGEGGYTTTTSPKYKYLYSGNFNVTMKATNSAGCTCEVTQKVSASTSVKTVDNMEGLSIYPNPNNGSFVISNSSNSGMTVEIFNVLGSKIYSKQTEQGNLNVNLTGESKGIYLVKVTINGVTTVNKVTLAQ